jgi:hypothetical protein
MSITVLIGLFFSIITIKLVITLENMQSIMMIGGIRNSAAYIVASNIVETRKLTLIRLTIRILSKVSTVILCLQGFYPDTRSQLLVNDDGKK